MQTQIRNYQIIRLLGQGGMGSVYLAEDNLLGRQVAIKVLAPHLVSDPKIVERFQQEAKIQAGLIHPNIIGLYNYFKEGADYYMVQEYFEGVTLKELIQRTGPIYESRAINIFNQLLEAIGYAHAKNVIHRDIKPSNILLDHNDYLKITDFGIAKIISDKNLTKTGSKLGTVSYMSPEQVTSQKDIDARTDIYSLGMTLYEMLCGKLPFKKEESEFNIMEKIVSGNFDSPTVFYPYISEHILNVLDLALKPDRNMRIGSTVEFINLINNNTSIPFQPAKIINNSTFPFQPINTNNNTAIQFQPINTNNTEINYSENPVTINKPTSNKKIIIGIASLIVMLLLTTIIYFVVTKKSQNINTENNIDMSEVQTPSNVEDFFNLYARTNVLEDASRHADLYKDPAEFNGNFRSKANLYDITSKYFANNSIQDVRFSILSNEKLSDGSLRVEIYEFTSKNNKPEDSGVHKVLYIIDKGRGLKIIRQDKG